VKWGEKLENCNAHWHDVLMEEASQEPMDASNQFCPKRHAPVRGTTRDERGYTGRDRGKA
jgi:hypothetical protein